MLGAQAVSTFFSVSDSDVYTLPNCYEDLRMCTVEDV